LPEDPPIESEQAHLAILEIFRREPGGGLDGRGFGGRGDDIHGFVPSEKMDRARGFENEHITTIASLLVDWLAVFLMGCAAVLARA
jgi:hypothetical protein